MPTNSGEFSTIGYSEPEEDLASHDRLIRAVQEVQEGVRELRGEGEKVYFEVFNDNLKSSITLTR
uniref:Cysteine protease, putative n=1 Tax=Oryza sativa subsp. japonica TaxID=39947 RepID=Q60ED5_ORYSJ|nr:cysteine protease, putative [Oryza sativa Japonica Group]